MPNAFLKKPDNVPAGLGITRPRFLAPDGIKGLELIDKKISFLGDNLMPPIPHLLTLPDEFRARFYPHENEKTPFKPHELAHLQQMTMLNTWSGMPAIRGIVNTQGAWEEDMEEFAAPNIERRRSLSLTPATGPAKARKKISLADYKNKGSAKPSPKVGSIGEGGDSAHSTSNSDISSAPMSRGPSFEGLVEGRISDGNGDGGLLGLKWKRGVGLMEVEKPVLQESASKPAIANETQLAPNTNGKAIAHERYHDVGIPLTYTGRNNNGSNSPPLRRPWSPSSIYHNREHSSVHLPVPKFSDTPKQTTPDANKPKRALEAADTPPEKRTKLDHPLTPSHAHKLLPRKPDSNSSPSKIDLNARSAQSSPKQKKATSISKIDTTASPKPSQEKPLQLPPLLSPLPADLDDAPLSQRQEKPAIANGIKTTNTKISNPNTPVKAPVGSDTIVVSKKTCLPESSPLSTPPNSSAAKSNTPLFVLPPLLSPGLPDVVEHELERLHQKTLKDEKSEKSASKTSSLNSVEARHEKVRRPDAPGVARKTVSTSKLGHPPKKTAESKASGPEVRSSLILKFKFTNKIINGKRGRLAAFTALARLPLVADRAADRAAAKAERSRLIAQPEKTDLRSDKDTLKVPAERPGKEKKSTSLKDEGSESDAHPSKAKATTSTTASKKRTSDHFESSETTQAKRAKLDIDVTKSRTSLESPFKSPNLSAPSTKSLLATPKKLDGMKSSAMRRVNSNDGQARTPQNGNTSTPASAEKHRPNGDPPRRHPDAERLDAENKKFSENALKLKRQMDEYLQSPAKYPNPKPVSERDKKLGLVIGIESMLNYMLSWKAMETSSRKRMTNWEQGSGLLDFLDGQTRQNPLLHNLVQQVGALLRQELARAYAEIMTPSLIEKLGKNQTAMDKFYLEAHNSRSCLKEIGVIFTLGPWSSVGEGVELVLSALEKYSDKERFGWRKI